MPVVGRGVDPPVVADVRPAVAAVGHVEEAVGEGVVGAAQGAGPDAGAVAARGRVAVRGRLRGGRDAGAADAGSVAARGA